ncbi:MAG: RecQ family ATP-dependent DNA helicase, partial [Candidatus Marinimicrobia bacterium]|nr:RecQ family ATP-dependent DNA helicase [Candidatus Neomarinimicrobiota bacterium]
FVAGGYWTAKKGEEEEERRAYYVAMTRARKTLTLFHREDDPDPYCDVLKNKLSGDQLVSLTPQIRKPIPVSVLQRRYDIIGLRDVYLDYAGRMTSSKTVHHQLGKIEVGDLVQLKSSGSKLEVCNSAGHPVAVLSKEAKDRWSSSLQNIESIKVIAMIERRADDSKDSDYSKLLKVDCWEVPVLEVVWSGACGL